MYGCLSLPPPAIRLFAHRDRPNIACPTAVLAPYQSGNGVVAPRLIKETKPAYTAEAMRARVQGIVRVQAVMLPDGSVGSVRVVRSLDTTFGLDDEALTAVRLWRFMPGTLAGRAVPVLVDIELAFTLR